MLPFIDHIKIFLSSILHQTENFQKKVSDKIEQIVLQ